MRPNVIPSTTPAARDDELPWIMTSWRRNTFVGFNMGPTFNWEDAIAAGDSYMRVHIRWGFHLDAPTTVDIQGVCSNLVTLGLVTTIGNGAETRPNARSGSGDAAPPTQRWIYWETRAPVVSAIDQAAGVITFKDSGSTEPSDTKGQVLATGIPGGDSLNLSSVWAPVSAFDATVNTLIWVSLSILRKV
jgi:hypothetical protein